MTLGAIRLEQELAVLGQGPGGWEECEEDEEQRVYLSGHVVAYGKIMPRRARGIRGLRGLRECCNDKAAGQSYPAAQTDV